MTIENIPKSDLYSRILAGEASDDDLKNFEQWLDESTENIQAFESFKMLWEAANQAKKYDLVRAKLRTEIKILEKLRNSRGVIFYLQRVAAVLILPFIFLSAYLFYSNTSSYTKTIEEISTPYGARTSFILPDSSRIWLNSGTKVFYPTHFGKTREISLVGEAYLEVQKNGKPFVVKTRHGDVQVLGTKFNVSAYAHSPFKTTLVEGSVEVSSVEMKDKVVLRPGFQCTLSGQGVEVTPVSSELYTSWKDGKLIFKREPFRSVAKRLERWFNVTIELEGDTIKDLWYTGSIEMESFSEVLELIKSTTPIEYSFNAKNRVLTISSKIK